MTLAYSNVLACVQSSPYGTLTADSTSFTAQTIESCNYAGEYATVTIPSAGTWTFESSIATDYLYLTDGSNIAIDSGITPVTITTTGSATIRLHVSADASCATQSSCRVTSVTKSPCLASSPYGNLNASGSTFNPQTIETCNYADEYATVTLPSGGIWTFGSSIATDFLVITSTNNTVLASGTQPLAYTATGADTLLVHIFTDANCGAQSSCRATTVTKSPCLSNTMYPSSVI
jgi:VCBS repeat-containing protein